MKPYTYKRYKSRNPVLRFVSKSFNKKICSIVKATNPRILLDVGAGPGTLLSYFNDSSATSLFGIDKSRYILKEAVKNKPEVPFVNADAVHLPFKDKSFDMVMAIEVLEHLHDYRRALKEMKRVSRSYCLITVPNEPFFRVSNFFMGKNISRWGNDPEHVQSWDTDTFDKLLKECFSKVMVQSFLVWNIGLCEI